MVKTVATLLMALTAFVPASGQKHKVCPPLASSDTVIVRVLPQSDEQEGERFKHGERDYGRHERKEHNGAISERGAESQPRTLEERAHNNRRGHRDRKNSERSITPDLNESRLKSADGDYIVDEDMSYGGTSANERYAQLKAALDEKFGYMFELKASLDRMQSKMSEKWSEYYALQEKYNRELKRIIGSWATESAYENYEYQK